MQPKTKSNTILYPFRQSNITLSVSKPSFFFPLRSFVQPVTTCENPRCLCLSQRSLNPFSEV